MAAAARPGARRGGGAQHDAPDPAPRARAQDAGAGPRITTDDLLDPRDADFTNPNDRGVVEPVLHRLCAEYAEYEASGSKSWEQTIDVRARPAWMREILGDARRPADRHAAAPSKVYVARDAPPETEAPVTRTSPLEKTRGLAVDVESAPVSPLEKAREMVMTDVSDENGLSA